MVCITKCNLQTKKKIISHWTKLTIYHGKLAQDTFSYKTVKNFAVYLLSAFFSCASVIVNIIDESFMYLLLYMFIKRI